MRRKGRGGMKQLTDYVSPFLIKRLPANGPTRSTIPVRGIALVSFLAMQEGVDPRSVRTFALLHRFVHSLPIK